MGKKSKAPRPDVCSAVNTGIYRRAIKEPGEVPTPQEEAEAAFDRLPISEKLPMFDNFLTSKMEGLSGFTNQEDFFAQTSPEFCAAIDAMHAKLIIQRMSQVLGNPEFNNQIVQYVINDALRLGGILERIHVRPYEPIVKAELSRRKKRGERRKQETILTDRQWNLVKDFISRRTVGGVSAAKACSQASAQLSTGTFPKLKGKRIEISPKSLQNLWSNRNK